MNIVTLLPFVVLIGAMFLMTRSAKKKQQKAAQMRDQMQPGTGIRTIGGMYALVKEVREDAVLLEVAPGLHALYAKNAIGAVLEEEEFERIVNGEPVDLKIDDAPVVPDDASALTEAGDADREGKIDLGKSGTEGDGDRAAEGSADDADKAAEPDDDAKHEAEAAADAPEDAKRKGDSGSK